MVDLVLLEVLDVLKELGNDVLGVGCVLPNTETFALKRALEINSNGKKRKAY